MRFDPRVDWSPWPDGLDVLELVENLKKEVEDREKSESLA